MNRLSWCLLVAAVWVAPGAVAQAAGEPGGSAAELNAGGSTRSEVPDAAELAAPAGSAAQADGSMRASGSEDLALPDEAGASPIQPGSTLGVEVLAGAGGRLDGVPGGYATHEPVDIAFQLTGWWAPSRTWSFGIGIERAGLGSARAEPHGDTANATFELNSLWASARWYPISFGPDARMFLGAQLGPGLAELSASGLKEPVGTFQPLEVFSCSALAPAGSLRAGPGIDIDLDRRLAFVVAAGAGLHVISSGVIGDCARGVGTTLTLGAQLGLMVRFGAVSADTKEAQTR